MSTNRSRQDLIEFLDYMANKGLAPKATVAARKAAVTQILGILNEDEAKNIQGLDLNAVMARFSNLKGKGYTPASLSTYQSRTKKAIDDFLSYSDNPLAFKPNGQIREKKQKTSEHISDQTKKAGSQTDVSSSQPIRHTPQNDTSLPIPLRADLTIHVKGIPFDLTKAEATKIANVIIALANE